MVYNVSTNNFFEHKQEKIDYIKNKVQGIEKYNNALLGYFGYPNNYCYNRKNLIFVTSLAIFMISLLNWISGSGLYFSCN